MTTELEQKFFDTFGVEPEHNKKSCKHCEYHTKSNFYDGCIRNINFTNCPNAKIFYPKITDRKLLEMICICNSTYINGYTNYFTATGKTKDELKEEILKKCITLSKDIKNKIQQLFEVEK